MANGAVASSAEWQRADVREVKLSRVEGKRQSEGESITSTLLEPIARDGTQETRRRRRSRL